MWFQLGLMKILGSNYHLPFKRWGNHHKMNITEIAELAGNVFRMEICIFHFLSTHTANSLLKYNCHQEWGNVTHTHTQAHMDTETHRGRQRERRGWQREREIGTNGLFNNNVPCVLSSVQWELAGILPVNSLPRK